MKPLLILILAATLPAAFLLGLHRGIAEQWPAKPVQNLTDRLTHNPVQFDDFGRLILYPNKQEIPCPPQTPQTAVLFAFGQSNSANHGGQRYRAATGNVVNYFDGKCYLAESPLLGASGQNGESWTLLGNKLIEANKFDHVIIVATGIIGTPIRRWAEGGDLNRMLSATLANLKPHYNVTHVLWHQGEADYVEGTTEAAYAAGFRSLVTTLKDDGITAPIYVSRASYEPAHLMSARHQPAPWQHDNPVTLAQSKLPDGRTIFPGPDTDLEVPLQNRYDGVHFSGSGQEATAAKWLEILSH